MSAPAGNSMPPEEVARMFDAIAARYDAMNTLMTAGADARWRAGTIRAAGLGAGMRVLDVACGTGKLTRAAATAVGPSGEVVGVDLSEGMLARARSAGAPPGAARPTFAVADALNLPFADGRFDAVLIGFGLRNLPDFAAALAEMARVARPGGRVVVLEIAWPRSRLGRAISATWFRGAIPLLGRLVGAGAAYRYLPDSLARYPDPEGIAGLMEGAGLTDIGWWWAALGMATIHAGRRSPEVPA